MGRQPTGRGEAKAIGKYADRLLRINVFVFKSQRDEVMVLMTRLNKRGIFEPREMAPEDDG